MNKETKLRVHNITAKAALKFGSEAWVSLINLNKYLHRDTNKTEVNINRSVDNGSGNFYKKKPLRLGVR